MATPVISTKLFVPPQRPRSVPRSRLVTRIDVGRAAGRRLTLVSAPAGFGKTTLLSAWIADLQEREPSTRVAWLSLDAGDNDPSRFLDHLLAALDASTPESGAPSPESVIAELINEIGEHPHPSVLILDDFQTIEAETVRHAVGSLIEHRPSNLHIVIASRSDPLLPLARLRGSGDLTELRASDLRFTAGEAAAFLNEMMGLELSTASITALEQRTEGWIAGLQLAALSMRERADVTGFIAAFTGSNRFVIDYLGEEVLQLQSPEVRNFLLQTAFLERMSAPLCDAVTGRTDSAVMLEALERDNLFVVPLDDERHWYRYHNLFADVLRARSMREDPDRVSVLHRSASAWHEQNDLLEPAIEHALAATDFARAAHLIERALPVLRKRRRGPALLTWLAALPDEATSALPLLSAFVAWSLLESGDLDGAQRKLDEAESALNAPEGHASAPGEELDTLPVTIAAYRAALAQGRGDVDGTERHARRALELTAADDHLGRGAGGGMLGLAQWARGDLEAAVPTFTAAIADLERAGHLPDAISSMVLLADMLVAQGRRRAARTTLDRAVVLARNHGEQSMVDLLVSLGELSSGDGDQHAAVEHLRAAEAPGIQPAMPENAHRWPVAMARVLVAEGDHEGALRQLDEAERRHVRGYAPDIRPIHAQRARVWIAQGRLADAAHWTDECGIAPDDELGYLREFEHITLARLLIARFRSDGRKESITEVGQLLERLLVAAAAGGRGASVTEVLVVQAMAFEAEGRRSDAHASIAPVLVVSQTEGYVRLLLDEGEPMVALLEATSPTTLSRLVGASRRLQAAGRVAGHATPGSEQLSERELTVLRLLATELSGPQIARELFVSLNTLRTHTKHIFTKLAVNSRPAAVRRAHERGLV